jgi:hypothetical protein
MDRYRSLLFLLHAFWFVILAVLERGWNQSLDGRVVLTAEENQ